MALDWQLVRRTDTKVRSNLNFFVLPKRFTSSIKTDTGGIELAWSCDLRQKKHFTYSLLFLNFNVFKLEVTEDVNKILIYKLQMATSFERTIMLK